MVENFYDSYTYSFICQIALCVLAKPREFRACLCQDFCFAFPKSCKFFFPSLISTKFRGPVFFIKIVFDDKFTCTPTILHCHTNEWNENYIFDTIKSIILLFIFIFIFFRSVRSFTSFFFQKMSLKFVDLILRFFPRFVSTIFHWPVTDCEYEMPKKIYRSDVRKISLMLNLWNEKYVLGKYSVY